MLFQLLKSTKIFSNRKFRTTKDKAFLFFPYCPLIQRKQVEKEVLLKSVELVDNARLLSFVFSIPL